MGLSGKNSLIFLVAILGMAAAWSEAATGKPANTPTAYAQPFSSRLIVKFRPTTATQNGANAAVAMNKPLSLQQVQQLQTAAGKPVSAMHMAGQDAHVVQMSGVQDRQSLMQAIQGISQLPNVEYVEEDSIEHIHMIPNDTNYATMWSMQPVSAVVGASPGFTGNYGADFEAAWNVSTGAGVVVAIVDTGILPHADIVGPAGTVFPTATGNLVSPGYDFITDCRMRGTCLATTTDTASIVTPMPNATDLGDYVSGQDMIDNPALFTMLSSSSWHGTHVAGTIAAIGNNALGVIGGAHGAKILPVRALGKGGGFSSDISNGILWAAGVHPTIANPNPAKVINLSLGSIASCGITRQNAINAAVAAGAVVVVAAGNDTVDVAQSNSANCDNVISVAAVGRDGSRAWYSNFSSPSTNPKPKYVTLAAQGGDTTDPVFDPGILSSSDLGTTVALGDAYVAQQGTSMAAPHVSAAVALMLSRNPQLTPAQVKMILSSPASLTAFPSFVTGWEPWDCALNQNCGAGILNANKAVLNSILSLSISAGDLAFGTATQSGNTINRTITLTNISAAAITPVSASFSGPGASRLNIVSNTCVGVSILSAGSCQVTVGLSPATTGATDAILTVALLDGSAVAIINATAQVVAAPSLGGGGGGGCSIMPVSGRADISLLLALALLILYRLWQRRTQMNRAH